MVNAVPSLYTASAQGWPVLLMAGNGQTDRRGLGDFQEAPQVEAATPFTKWSVAIDSPERIPYYVNAAFRRALNGRPGPVYLDFPADILEAEVDESEVEMFPPTAPPVRALGDPNLIAEALEEIKRASPRASALEGRLSIRPQSSVLRFSGRSARGKRPRAQRHGLAVRQPQAAGVLMAPARGGRARGVESPGAVACQWCKWQENEEGGSRPS